MVKCEKERTLGTTSANGTTMVWYHTSPLLFSLVGHAPSHAMLGSGSHTPHHLTCKEEVTTYAYIPLDSHQWNASCTDAVRRFVPSVNSVLSSETKRS